MTKRGHPVARVIPLPAHGRTSSLRGSLLFEEGIIAPIPAKWLARS